MKMVNIAVIGAGVVGMSSAVCIAEALPHCSVTILSKHFSPDTTSDVAAGILLPQQNPGGNYFGHILLKILNKKIH